MVFLTTPSRILATLSPILRTMAMTLHFGGSSSTILAVSWLNTVLYTSQVALSIYYLHHFTRTSKWLRYWILASLTLDGACSITDMAGAYMYLVINHGRRTFSWTIPTTVLLTYTSASIAQAFFCYRHWTIARNRWMTGWIICLITANMLASLISAVYITILSTKFILAIPVTTTVICAVTDTTIAGCLIWTCSHIESSFLYTRTLLRRVMIQALTCGFTTAIPTILMTVFLFTVWDAFYTLYATLGRIYSLTVLLTLMLLQIMHRCDTPTPGVDGDGSGSPAVLDSFRESMDVQFSCETYRDGCYQSLRTR
ncbi:uncharacterized protein EV420DRAFT_1546408, partial [Desarmillaria tabescens]